VPPKGQPGRPSLVGLPDAPKTGATSPHLGGGKTGAVDPHNQVMGVEAMSNAAPVDTGTHHSSLIGLQDQVVEGSVPGSACPRL